MNGIGLILDAHEISDLALLARKAEDRNFHSIWATELYRTSFQQLSVVAAATKKIKLGTAVALAFTRSPFITAITSLDIDEQSSGRLILGLGSGAKRTNESWHGVEHGKPVTKIKECIHIIRNIIKTSHLSEDFIYDGQYFNINTKGYYRAYKPGRDNIPIFLAGVGAKMTEASGQAADGYLGHVVCSKKYLSELVIKSIKRGLEKSGKDRKDFTLSSIITCAVSDNKREALDAARATIAFYATVKTYEPPFKLHGFEKECSKVRDAYFKRDIDTMIKSVSDDMVNAFAVVGTADECRKKIESYKDLVDLPILSAPHYFIDSKLVSKFQDSILDTFGK
ncbi:MAG: LLM class flavin-dependent oxidoreductase [Candidatus Dadabacteria bacterium]|nr:LLM class flavin-dependent oxidoreductase [Candidatus Dadabacteria bacterium]NIS07979.1 LLM class flavin-dependent oxidoreductase [Candidatus Dadabacteria bacterium]NIV43100.1 LLM class flavin-dependent oxidoreductase [Candidatus Dadabacteria bacterium]NIX14937.1 LLM class flavin-dependent oxidoreductase [Candidatus Dadabacteria bacterium]NIY21563.1 LLM class flavin-dependent oxidoreductase [Candidatus Dadabacteria bacterium]